MFKLFWVLHKFYSAGTEETKNKKSKEDKEKKPVFNEFEKSFIKQVFHFRSKQKKTKKVRFDGVVRMRSKQETETEEEMSNSIYLFTVLIDFEKRQEREKIERAREKVEILGKEHRTHEKGVIE